MDLVRNLNLESYKRPLVYSLLIFFVFYSAITIPFGSNTALYLVIALIGGFVVILEAFFSVIYINKHKKSIKEENHKFIHHGINHMLYPVIYYVGFLIYAFYKDHFLMIYILAVFSLIFYFLHFYLLPLHLANISHAKPHLVKRHIRVDFIMYIFKFLSYFMLNLALFELLYLQKISLESVVVVNFIINSFYLFSHLNRKENVNFSNLLITYLFAFLSTIFIIKAKVNLPNVSAAVATIIFYLTSGIYYHKVDGTFSLKVLAEYFSIALILSILLFSV
jgi:hypothetical protein